MYTPVNAFKGHMRKHNGKTVKQLSKDTEFLSGALPPHLRHRQLVFVSSSIGWHKHGSYV